MAHSIKFEVTDDPFNKSPNQGDDIQKYQRIAEVYFKETEENRSERLEEFKQSLRSQHPEWLKNLPTDDFLLKILRAGGFTVDGAIGVLTRYVKMMNEAPKYFSNAFNALGTVKKVYQHQLHLMLSSRDKNGRRVYIWRPGFWDPDVMSFSDVFCCGYMLCEMVSREEKTQMTGVTCVMDGSNFGFKQFRQVSFEDLYSAQFIQVRQ